MSTVVNKGSILIYRAFDIGEDINLSQATALLQQAGEQLPREVTVSYQAQGVIVKDPPLRINLGESIIELRGGLVKVETIAKLWSYGVVTITFKMPIKPGTDWQSLVQTASDIELVQFDAQHGIDAVARRRAQALVKILNGAVSGPAFWKQYEDYTVYLLESVEGIIKARELIEKADVASLVFSEVKQGISAASRSRMDSNIFQYQDSDMVVVDWNSAVVLEPTGTMDVPNILEFVLTHLLEMRYYDNKIGRSLNDIYVMMNSRQSLYQRLLGRKMGQLSESSTRTYIELTEFLERIQNSLKMVGDAYLATVFRAAVHTFRLQEWENSVNHKMQMLAQASELVQGEANTKKAHLMEFTVIILIAFEILKSFIWG